ncbi:unnamed protein product [Schistosoma turkestanicum]|nr:unnamed protein product [Schistosoma turkestanicum]
MFRLYFIYITVFVFIVQAAVKDKSAHDVEKEIENNDERFNELKDKMKDGDFKNIDEYISCTSARLKGEEGLRMMKDIVTNHSNAKDKCLENKTSIFEVEMEYFGETGYLNSLMKDKQSYMDLLDLLSYKFVINELGGCSSLQQTHMSLL